MRTHSVSQPKMTASARRRCMSSCTGFSKFKNPLKKFYCITEKRKKKKNARKIFSDQKKKNPSLKLLVKIQKFREISQIFCQNHPKFYKKYSFVGKQKYFNYYFFLQRKNIEEKILFMLNNKNYFEHEVSMFLSRT